MNPHFQHALRRATELTRAGRLGEATAAIQQALAEASGPATPATDPPPRAGRRGGAGPGEGGGAGGSASRSAGGAAGGDVIDVDARVVDEPAPTRRSEGPRNPARHGGDAARPLGTPQPATGAATWSPGRHDGPAGGRGHWLYQAGRADESGRPPALVVMLHGCSQTPEDFAVGTRMNAHAEARGWWVLYPAQDLSANGAGCWNWFKPGDQQRGQGEPAILADMVRSLVSRHGLDPHRVFVAGLSAGGAMAATLAATHPDLFAAAGVHSGLPHGSASDLMSALSAMRQGSDARSPAHTVPLIVFHGDRDDTVHPCNGDAVLRQSRAFANAPAGASATASRASPPADDTEAFSVPGGRSGTRRVHRGAQGRVDAEHWLVHGAGHAWSGGSAAGSFTDPLGPDASAQMLRFFDAQRPG